MYKITSKERCGACAELRRAAIGAVQATHQAFLLVLEAIDAGDDSHVDILMQAAEGRSRAKVEIVNEYMDHLQTHCDEDDEEEAFAMDA
jgi:hypothetical protein